MNEQPSHRPNCQPWERPWRTFFVDEKLENDWLERLNDLKHFRLISICQGHADAPEDQPRRRPHFNLRLKDEFLDAMIADWASVKDGIADALDRSFNTVNTSVHLELRTGYVKNKKGVAAQDILLLKIARQFDLLSPQPSDPFSEWFEENVAATEVFDRFCTSLITR